MGLADIMGSRVHQKPMSMVDNKDDPGLVHVF